MVRYPGASWDPLGPQTEPRMQAHDIACLHTMVGTLAGTSAFFHQNGYGGTESHFGMGHNGATVQWQDINHEADANYDGNHRVISMETADKGAGFPTWSDSDVPAWTSQQVDKLVDWLLWVTSTEAHVDCPASWLCHQVGIPRVLVPDSRPGRRGIAYHRQGIDSYPELYKAGWRQPGGELWSGSRGKVCPGDRRIHQLVTVVIPRVQATTALPQEDPMATLDAEDKAWLASLFGWLTTGRVNSNVNPDLREWAFADDASTVTLNEIADRIPTAEAIATAVVAKLPAGSVDVAAVTAAFRGVLAAATQVGHFELAEG